MTAGLKSIPVAHALLFLRMQRSETSMNSSTSTVRPLLYQADYEYPEEGEEETRAGLLTALHKISETTLKDEGHALRSVHAKSHGLLRGTLHVLDTIPDVYAQGLFAQAGEYPVVMRISTVPGDLLDDSISTPRGLAIKVVGVPGERLPGSENATTQDFVMVNGPVFGPSGPKKFLGNLKLLASTTDKAPGLKKALAAVLRGTEKVVESLGGESATLKSLGGHPQTNVLGETFFSQVPILFGPYMAKISVAPVSRELIALVHAPVDLSGKPNGLREAVIEHFSKHGGEWELRVQLCTDIDAMPIEDASVEWPQAESPYVAVARITAAPQTAWSPALSKAIDEGLAFSPWHGIQAHRPLGAVMRVRKAAYDMSAAFRMQHNRKSLEEPTTLDNLSDC
jgi:Catalase